MTNIREAAMIAETGDVEQTLKLDLMRMDLVLKTKQGFWETPRNLAIVLGAAVAITSAVAGTLGFKLGQQERPAQPVIVNVLPSQPRQ